MHRRTNGWKRREGTEQMQQFNTEGSIAYNCLVSTSISMLPTIYSSLFDPPTPFSNAVKTIIGLRELLPACQEHRGSRRGPLPRQRSRRIAALSRDMHSTPAGRSIARASDTVPGLKNYEYLLLVHQTPVRAVSTTSSRPLSDTVTLWYYPQYRQNLISNGIPSCAHISTVMRYKPFLPENLSKLGNSIMMNLFPPPNLRSKYYSTKSTSVAERDKAISFAHMS
ncbi:hypothetical protein C8F01DRAFT_1331237 [Mycena amicta]|nr:hypothetical protein C8F01DRAFT_1331237 [Mycena amicta]